MNTVNYRDPGAIVDPTYVGVDHNRLVVTSGLVSFGTFAATTDGNFTALPYNKATSIRINNHTGKMIGIRRRHKKVVIDDFEDSSFTNWTGSITFGDELEGLSGALISDSAYTKITPQVMLSGSEVVVMLRTPSESEYNVKISVLDDITRLGIGSAGEAELTNLNSVSNTKYIVTIRLREDDGKYDAFYEVEGKDRQVLAEDQDAVFGTNQMVDSLVHIQTDKDLVIDPVIYNQKVNYSAEQIGHGGSFIYPCVANSEEYEIVNLGSDLMNYSDSTQTISISGFYAT